MTFPAAPKCRSDSPWRVPIRHPVRSPWHAHRVPPDTFREFPDFAPAFEPAPPLRVGAYLLLLNLTEQAPQAVAIVAGCLQSANSSPDQVTRLLRGALGWRPQLVGCVALLAAQPPERPLHALREAACRPSWVAPQLLAALSLVDTQDWPTLTERCIVDLGDPKAAAALQALSDDPSPDLVELAARDAEGGDEIARRWRNGIGPAFDEAGLTRTW